eukprot:6811018-Prymnesium_polylepis.1
MCNRRTLEAEKVERGCTCMDISRDERVAGAAKNSRRAASRDRRWLLEGTLEEILPRSNILLNAPTAHCKKNFSDLGHYFLPSPGSKRSVYTYNGRRQPVRADATRGRALETRPGRSRCSSSVDARGSWPCRSILDRVAVAI